MGKCPLNVRNIESCSRDEKWYSLLVNWLRVSNYVIPALHIEAGDFLTPASMTLKEKRNWFADILTRLSLNSLTVSTSHSFDVSSVVFAVSGGCQGLQSLKLTYDDSSNENELFQNFIKSITAMRNLKSVTLENCSGLNLTLEYRNKAGNKTLQIFCDKLPKIMKYCDLVETLKKMDPAGMRILDMLQVYVILSRRSTALSFHIKFKLFLKYFQKLLHLEPIISILHETIPRGVMLLHSIATNLPEGVLVQEFQYNGNAESLTFDRTAMHIIYTTPYAEIVRSFENCCYCYPSRR